MRHNRRSNIGFGAALLAVALTCVIRPAYAQDAPSDDRSRAIACLAQAISYEAGNEPVEGQEAVAQVILNRFRHPAYPKSVCGVVFQGSERRTGCQFTFTCDGSLLRPRSALSMTNATAVANRVFDGLAATLIGGATHYHANYVSPYWAPSLVRVGAIGAHIFYRMPGAPDFAAIVSVGTLRSETSARAVEPAASAPRTAVFAPFGIAVFTVDPSGRVRPVTPGR